MLSIYYRAVYTLSKDTTWDLVLVKFLKWVLPNFSSPHSFELIDCSCIEMLVGVICACMPSFSKLLRHHHSEAQQLKSFFFSSFSILRSTVKGIRGTMTASTGGGRYLNENSCQSHNFVPLDDAVSTFIGGGERLSVPENVIYMKQDIEQQETIIKSFDRAG